MKDEIKILRKKDNIGGREIEIISIEEQAIDILRQFANIKEDEEIEIEIPLNNVCQIVLDYITNLQVEINKLTAESTEWESKCYNLQEENERLKNGYCELKVKCNNGECDCTNEEYDGMVQANMKGKLLLEDYKSRNEKAIEYIKSIEYEDGFTNKMVYYDEDETCIELLNILQGSDK